MFTLCRHWLFAIATCVALATAANAADTRSAGDIVAVAVHGDVRVTMGEVTTPLYADAIIQLPATIRSAANGSFELRQGPTTMAAAGNTELEIPVSALADGLIERVVQVTGNAFYSVGKRERTKLRVETPFLVAVIKGTQFNVASQQDSTTIALFEGRLEVRATDESDVVDLQAGEIAIRNRNDISIRVLRMTATASNTVPRNQNVPAVAASDNGAATPGAGTVAGRPAQSPGPLANVTADAGGAAIATDVAAEPGIGVSVSGGPVVNGADLAAKAEVATGSGGLGVAASIGTPGAGEPVQAAVAVNVGSGSVAASTSASISVAGVAAGANVATAVDLGSGSVSAGVGATANVGVASASLGVTASTNLSTGSVAASTNTAISAGPVSVAASTGAAVDLGSGSVAANTSAGVSLGSSVSASASTSASVAPSSVSVAAGSTVSAGNAVAADLGVSASAAPSNVAVSTVANTSVAGISTGASVAASVAPSTGASVAVSVAPVAVTPALGVTASVSPTSGVSAGVSVGNLVSVGTSASAPISVNIGGSDTGGGLLGGLLNRNHK